MTDQVTITVPAWIRRVGGAIPSIGNALVQFVVLFLACLLALHAYDWLASDEGGRPVPEPVVPDDDDDDWTPDPIIPDDDDSGDPWESLESFSKRTFAEVGRERPSDTARLGAVYEAVAGKIVEAQAGAGDGRFKETAFIDKVTRDTTIKTIGADDPGFRGPLETLERELERLSGDGTLRSTQDHIYAWSAIADGIRSAARG